MASLDQTSSPEETENDQLLQDNPYQNYSWMQLQDTLAEKEYLLECAQDNIKQLSVFKAENIRKDEVIASLRKDLAAFKKNSRKKDFSYVSMEEHVASCEAHLSEKNEELKTLQQELEDVKQKLEASSAHSRAIQKELLTKKSADGHHLEEVTKLQRQHRSDSESISSLKKEISEKQSTIVSLQERVKRLRCTNQDLQKRLEGSQAENDVKTLNEQKLKAELAKLKNQASNGKLVEARQEFCEQELTKSKRKENDLACEIGRLRQELTSMCKNIATLTNTASSTGSVTQSMALNAVSKLVEEHSQATGSISTLHQQLEELENRHSTMCERIEELQQFWSDFENAMEEDLATVLDPLISSFQKKDSMANEGFKKLKDSMLESLNKLSSYVTKQSSTISQLNEMIIASYGILPNHEKETDEPIVMLSHLTEKLQSTLSECKQLNQRLCESELNHGAALSGAVAALRQDEDTRMSKLFEKTRKEEMEKWSSKLHDLQQMLEMEKKEAVQQEQANTSVLVEELKQMKVSIDQQQTDHEILKAKLLDVESDLASLQSSKNEALQKADAQKAATVHQLTTEIDAYKTKAHQYAITIAALEDKLLKMMNKIKMLQGNNENVETSLSAPTSDTELAAEVKLKKMKELVEVLRHQLALASDDGASKESQIKQLVDEVNKVTMRIQEKETEFTQHHSEVIDDLRLTLTNQEGIIESQKMEIEQLKCRIKELTSLLSTQEKHSQRATEEMAAIKSRLKQSDSIQTMVPVHTQGSESSIFQVGQKCLGKKHGETIQSQQEAISQLRHRLSNAESAHPPVGSHLATLKELSRVRGELFKLKSEKHLATTPNDCEDSSHDNKQSLKKDVELLREHKAKEKALQETLNFSERSYKELAEAIYKALPDLHWPDIGALSAEAEYSSRKQMLMDRTTFADSVTRSLREIATKKEEGETNPVVDEQTLENIAQLEAQLSSVSEELEQHKRLNKALLKRKDFKETQHSEFSRRPQHNCKSN